VLFCHPESDASTAKHKGLGKQFGITGLPGIAFFTADAESIVQIPASAHSVAQFEKYLQRAQQMLVLRAGAAKGEPRAAAQWLIAQLEECQVDLVVGQKRRALLAEEDDAERARLDELLLNLQIGAEILAVHDSPEQRRVLGGRYLDMLGKGMRPSPEVSRGFWFVILEHCEAAGDVKGFAIGLEGLRREVERSAAGAEWGVELVRGYEQKLVKLQAGKQRAVLKTPG
jgi:hypothetical protein